MDPSIANDLPLWYLPTVGAMKVGDAVRRGCRLLRVIAFVVVAVAVVGGYLRHFDEESGADDRGPFRSVSTTWREFLDFLGELTFPVALAAMIFAFSFVLKNSVARLDLNIVLASEQAELGD